MATIQIQKQKKRKAKDTSKVFEWARNELRKAEDLLIKRKSQVILETAKKLEDAGIETNLISMEIIRNLKGYVDDQYVREVLTDYPQYKNQYQANRARKRKSGSENRAQHAQPHKPETIQTPLQMVEEEGGQEDDNAPQGYYQTPVEEFKIEWLEQYDRAFLIKIVQYLYDLLQQQQQQEVRRKNG